MSVEASLLPKEEFRVEAAQVDFPSSFGNKPSFLIPPSKQVLLRLYDVVLLAPSIIVAIFLAFCVKLNGEAEYTDKWTTSLQQASQLGPTIFPILFAIVIGQTIWKITRWRLEKGATIGLLEQLHGSSTLVSTVAISYKLRHCSLLSLGLLAAWALSPLGGQATLRILEKSDEITTGNVDLWFPLLNSSTTFMGKGAADTEIVLTNTLFLSALTTTIERRNASVDNNGYVKIPFLSSVKDTSSDDGSSTWTDVSILNGGIVFSALTGIPVTNLPTDGDVEFTMESPYFTLDCPIFDINNLNNRTIPAADNHTFFNVGKSGVNFGATHHFNFSNATGFGKYTRDLYIKTDGFDPIPGFYAQCNLTQEFVESRIACTNGTCSVNAIRSSQIPHNLIDENYYQIAIDPIYLNFLSYLLEATAPPELNTYNLVESYITNITNPLWPFSLLGPLTNTSGGRSPIDQLTNEIFAYRLAQLLNTFWQAGTLPYTSYASLSPEDVKDIINNASPANPVYFGNTTAQTQLSRTHYKCSIVWGVILLVCCLVLLVAGLLNLLLGLRIRGPDFLGYVSSLTRDNKYCPTPEGGSTMNGDERSRLLKDLRVQLVDTNKQDIGHLAISWSSPDDDKTGFDPKKEYS